jgi:hypothetical protein
LIGKRIRFRDTHFILLAGTPKEVRITTKLPRGKLMLQLRRGVIMQPRFRTIKAVDVGGDDVFMLMLVNDIGIEASLK